MGLFQSFVVAVRSLAGNKLRTLLTMLGIIIGVGAVLALLALGNGTTQNVVNQLQANGTNLITVRSGAAGGVRAGGGGGGLGSAQTLTYEDAVALSNQATLPHVLASVPELGNNAQIVNGSLSSSYRVIGTTPNYGDVHVTPTSSGNWFNDVDLSASANVIVVGPTIVTDLFNGIDPVGQTVLVNHLSFRIVGVLVTKGGGGFGSSDDQAYVPITTGFNKLFGKRPTGGVTGHVISTITLQASDSNSSDAVISEATDVLRTRHKTSVGADDFSVISQSALLGTLTGILSVITGFLGSIAFISLLVGGIGIMNIMLVSVTERTREIGIRKALGATNASILTQFLVEALVVSLLGGLLGIALGAAISFGVSDLGGRLSLFGGAAVTASISLSSIVLAVGFSLAIGLFFGIYPAWRAAKLNPIDALRYE